MLVVKLLGLRILRVSLFSFVPNDLVGCETPIGAMMMIIPVIQRSSWFEHILIG